MAALATLTGTGSIGGLGHVQVCASDRHSAASTAAGVFTGGYAARPGAVLQPPAAPLSACAIHPGTGQQLLYSLTAMPQVLLWGGIVLLLGRLLVTARRDGPFTTRAAAAMRALGWYIIAGPAMAAAIQQLAAGLLLGSLVTPSPEGTGWAVIAALRALTCPSSKTAGPGRSASPHWPPGARHSTASRATCSATSPPAHQPTSPPPENAAGNGPSR